MHSGLDGRGAAAQFGPGPILSLSCPDDTSQKRNIVNHRAESSYGREYGQGIQSSLQTRCWLCTKSKPGS